LILVLAALFALLLAGRLGGGYRFALAARWPAMAFAGAALLMLARGQIWIAFGLGGLAAMAWFLWPSRSGWRRRSGDPNPEHAKDAEARAVLGVGSTATESEIRNAYRTKMARAHPDRGGSNAEAARLTAARDRLLRKR
jgi:hypothetical protein